MGQKKTPDHLKAIADTATDAIITADAKGRIVSWNAAARRIFGYGATEVTGKPLEIIIPKSFRQGHKAGIRRVTAGGKHRVIGKVVELMGLRKDGTEFPIELSLSTWVSDEGRYYGGIIRDITERKRTESLLRASENRTRSIMESANDGIITADRAGIILSWNDAARRIFGYTEKEVTGKPLTVIIPEHFRSGHETGIRRVTGGGPHHVIGKTVELCGLHKTGHEVPIELSLSTWEAGADRFYSGIVRDISERRQAEARQRETEMKFRSITESANDAIIAADQDGLILSWNPAAEKIFGYSGREVVGKSLAVIVPEQFRSAHEKGLARAARGGAHRVIGKTVELEGLHKSGKTFPIELSLSMWSAGDKRFFSGIIRDISARKKTERKLQEQRDKLSLRTRELKKLNGEVQSKNEQLEALSNKLAKYLSRQVYTSIFEGKKDVKIESYRKKLTIFFSDIQGFTELTDSVESETLTNVLNKYLNEMSKIALDHGGTIDKYIGDAIMIFFGDPESCGEKQDAMACIRMALAMKKRLCDLRREWDTMGISRPLRVRMGINTGYCTVGNFGSDERLDYTIVGGPVNLASRLEAAAPIDEILISGHTYALVKDQVACEMKECLKVKGQARPVQTYLVKRLIREKAEADDTNLQANLRGFNLSIDFSELDYNDKINARKLLEKAISKL